MLEVFYEVETKIVTAWRSGSRIDIRELRDGESKVLLDIDPPSVEGATARDYLYDEASANIGLNPDYVEPVKRDSFAEIDAIKVKLDGMVKALDTLRIAVMKGVKKGG